VKTLCCFEALLVIYPVGKLFCIDHYCYAKLSVIPGKQKNKNARDKTYAGRKTWVDWKCVRLNARCVRLGRAAWGLIEFYYWLVLRDFLLTYQLVMFAAPLQTHQAWVILYDHECV